MLGIQKDTFRRTGRADRCVCPAPNHDVGRSHPPSLPQLVQWFKTMTTNDYILGVRRFGFTRFRDRLWQRNYYEHIIRNDCDLERIRAYIDANPARWGRDIKNVPPPRLHPS